MKWVQQNHAPFSFGSMHETLNHIECTEHLDMQAHLICTLLPVLDPNLNCNLKKSTHDHLFNATYLNNATN